MLLSVTTRWVGNVARNDEIKYAHKFVIREIERKRQQGRPRHSWKVSIEKEKRIEEIEYVNMDCNIAKLYSDCLTLKLKTLRSVEVSVTVHRSTGCDVT
jgi:hypothetical protein